MKPPLMPAGGYPDPALNALFEELDQQAEQAAAADPRWPVSEAGWAIFARLMTAAVERAPECGFDAVLLGIAGGMPPEGRDTAREALQRLSPALQQRGRELWDKERQQLAKVQTSGEYWRTLADSMRDWSLTAEGLGPGGSAAYACGLIWLRLHQRHEARVFLLPQRAEGA